MNEQLELWNRYCEYLRTYPEIGISIDISRMRFSSDFFSTLAPKVSAALKEMEELEAGAIANPDEKRMVGHYWLRTPEKAPNADIRNEIERGIKEIAEFSQKILSGEITSGTGERFETLLLIGIGGSALGPQLISDALGDLYRGKSGLKLAYFDNTDPDGIQRTLRSISLRQTLTVVISKSGGTVETRNGMLEAENAYNLEDLDFGKNAAAITMSGSALEKVALSNKWLKTFNMFDWVGGRTSLFSAVGLLPAALEGIPITELLSGAREMDEITREKDPMKNPAALLAVMWHFAGSGVGKKDMVVLPYKDRLVLFSKYLQQLVMESLGKEFDLSGKTVNQGIAVYGNKGSTDQHAYVQQLRDGINNFFATFIEVLSDFTTGSRPAQLLEVKETITSGDYLNGFLQGSRSALYEKGRDSITITLDELTPFTLGAVIALYERAVGLYASLVSINAYHQPGVEAGKKAAERVVEIQQLVVKKGLKGSYSAEEIAAAIAAPGEVETVYKVLRHLAADGRGIRFERGGSPKEDHFLF